MPHADLARLAQAAYSRKPEWVAKDNPRARAMLNIAGGVPIISVPGTDPRVPDDLATDADCDAVYVPGLGSVHEGFLRIAMSIYPQIVASVVPAEKIILTGHSLGAAVAMVLAALLARDCHAKEIELIGFGCPRVGAQRLAVRLWGVKTTLYRFGNDPVPLVPWLLLWRLPPVIMMHPAPLTKIGTPLPELISNHAIGNYVAELTKLGR